MRRSLTLRPTKAYSDACLEEQLREAHERAEQQRAHMLARLHALEAQCAGEMADEQRSADTETRALARELLPWLRDPAIGIGGVLRPDPDEFPHAQIRPPPDSEAWQPAASAEEAAEQAAETVGTEEWVWLGPDTKRSDGQKNI